MPDEKLQLGITVGGKYFEVTAEPGDCLIDTALKNDVDAPYSCLEGVCISCMAQLKEGEVDFPSDTILSDEDFSDGKVLTCQAKFTAGCKRIVIDYDAV